MDAIAEYALFLLGLMSLPAALVLFGVAAVRRSRRVARIGVILLGISALAFARVRYAQFWEIDACLDRGYSYDYERKRCEQLL